MSDRRIARLNDQATGLILFIREINGINDKVDRARDFKKQWGYWMGWTV